METDPGETNSDRSELVRNSAIPVPVNIDDLAEGLVVVSFTHCDNLYQGVLFQLNRERGIPSGISFAKEQALTTEKVETDPSQITPLHQRHTYVQSNGNSNGASHGSISQPSLRRVIKPPARFKNARMSLRLRARPVLCAKCMTLCDDKAADKAQSPKDDNDNQNQTDKLKKDRAKLSGTISALSGSGRPKGTEQSFSSCPIDPKDLCYETVGNSRRIVENYWKRPLVKPLASTTEEVYARLRKHKVSSDSRPETASRRKRAKSSNSSTCTSTSVSLVQANGQDSVSARNDEKRAEFNNPTRPVINSTRIDCDRNFPNTRSRKQLNLKLCITKLTDLRDLRTKNKKAEIEFKASCSTSEDENSKCLVQDPNSPQSGTSSSESTVFTDKRIDTSAKVSSNARASSKRQKDWENRIRTKSNVPVRYRDESYLTKNIFNFNKRRSQTEDGDIPVLTISRRRSFGSAFKISTSTESADATVSTSKASNEDDFRNSHDEENDNESGGGASAATAQSFSSPTRDDSNSYDASSSPHSPTSSSNIIDTAPNSSYGVKLNGCKPEMTKTPTIKITFGSSGNGVVIPPKDTQNVECSSTTDLKAVKKALKKAKKEAKRKRSISPSISPGCTSPNFVPRCERSNPSPPSPSIVAQGQKEEISSDDGMNLSVSGGFDGETLRLSKKKKKQKKKRRSSKTLKENDCFAPSTSSGHDLEVCNLSSPPFNSLVNPDSSACSGRCTSPGNVSVKSCNLDSISNPDSRGPFDSFSKDVPRRRSRSTPNPNSPSSENPQRVCINLKRIDRNAYIPLPLQQPLPTQQQPEGEDSNSESNDAGDDDESEQVVNDNPANASSSNSNGANAVDSVENYKDKTTGRTFKRGDIVWGKLPFSPWWPGKIIDIMTENSNEALAKVSWYKSTTQSCVGFNLIAPFVEDFHKKFSAVRRRESYQYAVREALMEISENVSSSDELP